MWPSVFNNRVSWTEVVYLWNRNFYIIVYGLWKVYPDMQGTYIHLFLFSSPFYMCCVVRIMCYPCVVYALASTGVSTCVCMCLHKKDRNQHQIPFFICFYLYFLRNDILLNLKLIVLARLTGQWASPFSRLISTKFQVYIAMLCILCGFWSSSLRSSCFTDWTIIHTIT